MSGPWPFEDARNTTSITLRDVLNGKSQVLFVSHDEDDGMWQFLDGRDAPDPADACVVGLGCMVELDPTVAELADLPLGWVAWRDSVDTPWQRALRPEEWE